MLGRNQAVSQEVVKPGVMEKVAVPYEKITVPENPGEVKAILGEAEGQVIYRTVRPGETLTVIVQEHYGNAYGNGKLSKWREVFADNMGQLKNPNIIYPGQVLILRGVPAVSAAPASATPASASTPVGGINLDPTGLVIDSGGQVIQFDVPIDPQILQNLQSEPVTGFEPVILNIVPLYNLPQFLGVKKPAATKDPLAAVRRL